MTSSPRPARILPAIVVSQLAGSSTWFAGNAVLRDLEAAWHLAPGAIGQVTSAVQLGFIAGTLVFALVAIADRFSPRRVFLLCALAAALANAALLAAPPGLATLLACRFATGFFLAGIYPVGMKIASGWYRSGLGSALGFLVGALILGTAFPHLLKALGQSWPWERVVAGVSLTCAAGGLVMVLLVPDGPYLSRSQRFDAGALARVFAVREFRASACGYFGHMWELYAFLAFAPLAIARHVEPAQVSLWSFWVIAAGAVGCVAGGLASLRFGSARVAALQLAASGLCCLASPLLLVAPAPVALGFLVFWGVVVSGDSPQFSALNAANAPREWVGSALTIANCIGFAITIVSLQLLSVLAEVLPAHWLFVWLAPGPALGLLALRPLLRRA
ncbi:MAG: MFS transporter [Burkholderiales bacterium]|nr:MFS transporter [Burkholderiales bacterium]